MVFAIHFKIHPQRGPARAKIGFPLQFHIAARDGQRPFAPVLIIKGDGVVFRVHMLHRHIQNPPRFGVNRQETRIGLLAFFAQTGKHDRHDRVIAFGG